MLSLLGPRIFKGIGSNVGDLGEEQGHRVLRVHGAGDKIVLVPLPAAVGRAIERAIGSGPSARSCSPRDIRMHRHCATRRLRRLAEQAGRRHRSDGPAHAPAHLPHHHFDAGVELRDVQIAARHAGPRTTMRNDRARKNLDRHPNYILAAYMAPAPASPTCRRARAESPQGY